MSSGQCETEGCGKTASLVCPTCVKLGLPGGNFCSQECFKGYWKQHKRIHKLMKAALAKKASGEGIHDGFEFTGDLRPGRVSARRPINNPDVVLPDYAETGVPVSEDAIRGNAIPVLSEEEIECARASCALGRRALNLAGRMMVPGTTTDEVDAAVHELIVSEGGYPSPLNYRGFPKSLCTSINEIICHGIPDSRPMESGDIVNVDISVYYRGFHSDLNETFLVGEVDDEKKHLVEVSHASLEAAIALCRPGVRFSELGEAIMDVIEPEGMTSCRAFCGHGVGKVFHGNPTIPHYRNSRAVGVMKPGQLFTIEPMISTGKSKVTLWNDGWTAAARDGKPSAQFEHTILITEDGHEVLTRRNDGKTYLDCLVDED